MKQMALSGGPANFTISVDSQVVGKTAQLLVDGMKGSGRNGALLAHELTHLLQNRRAPSASAKKLTFGTFESVDAVSSTKTAPDTRPLMSRGKRVRISTQNYGAVEFTSQGTTANAHQQEWTLVYENIQRVV